MYNKFATKTQKGGPWTTNLLYNKNSLIGRLNSYFSVYFETFSVPTAQTLFLLVLSILALTCSHAKADYSRFMNVTAPWLSGWFRIPFVHSLYFSV